LGIAIVVLIAVAIPWGLVGPTKPDTKAYDKAVSAALLEAKVNESSASGAPQQQVVNGWLARDLMEVQIKQSNDELVLMHLIVAVLVGALLALVVGGLVATASRSRTAVNSATDPVEPLALD
jgi:hypothetical protein